MTRWRPGDGHSLAFNIRNSDVNRHRWRVNGVTAEGWFRWHRWLRHSNRILSHNAEFVFVSFKKLADDVLILSNQFLGDAYPSFRLSLTFFNAVVEDTLTTIVWFCPLEVDMIFEYFLSFDVIRSIRDLIAITDEHSRCINWV